MAASKIEIALWPRGPQAEAYFPAILHRYYQQNRSAQVSSYWMNMQDPWSDVSQTMLQRSGPDITEIGTSWVESLVATNSLRPFSAQEFQALGGADAFIMPAWKSQKHNNVDTVYSIPHMTDARHIYYRRDLLAQAGVDEETAFANPENILQTLECLKRAGIRSPLVAPITMPHLNLSFVASWVWSTGADFIDSAGTQAGFNAPNAIAGIADYFRTMQYILPEYRRLDIAETDAEFCRGNAAITLSGSWLYHVIQQTPEFEMVKANLGMALPAGQACCGGTHLVIWKHCVEQEAAFEFVRFLASAQVQADLAEINFVIPTRFDANDLTPYAADPNYQVLVETIHSGRSYGASPFWNILEDRLSRTLVQLWAEYFNTPDVDANAFLSTHLGALARRINLTLEE